MFAPEDAVNEILNEVQEDMTALAEDARAFPLQVVPPRAADCHALTGAAARGTGAAAATADRGRAVHLPSRHHLRSFHRPSVSRRRWMIFTALE